ncbi:LysM peptidoglycan-binding domain-containing protein [Halobacillus sp. A5]|uniref:LysM peptidoglycan-binding domain-containing protein n=1 Tax=Halobacillus sp. A5 TaxID=2880263 RepID=UPI0020A676FB|nr:LysM peptidoglycan-binding domain-containing protein [Halobacillus sp. A5]MCP3027193.1 LysM peptidoglycan-binding domain-containing protein [Halobacillus sp. A5]
MSVVDRSFILYPVQARDTLYSIATGLGSQIPLIERANALYPPFTEPDLIYPGQMLVVPVFHDNQVNQIISRGDTLYQIARDYYTNIDILQGLNPEIQHPNFIYIGQVLRVPGFIYEVEQGDTLNSISQQFGYTLTTLLQANRRRPGLSADVIVPGYQLVIPYPSSTNILVMRPFPGAKVRSGQTLSGYARAFEGSILYQVLDSSGRTIIPETAVQTSAGGPSYGTFSVAMSFEQEPPASSGEIWVYTRSAKDGSVQDLVKIQVRFH